MGVRDLAGRRGHLGLQSFRALSKSVGVTKFIKFVISLMGGDDVTTMNSGQPVGVQTTRDTSMANWINDRRAILVANNKDNVLLESGTARIRANELIKPGCYVRIVRGTFASTFYVSAVDVDYVAYQGLFQTLKLERGNGFVLRQEAGAGVQSPYLAELSGLSAG